MMDNDNCSWLVVDVRDGGCDGYYSKEDDAIGSRDEWRKRLGHDDVIVTKANWDESQSAPRIGQCSLSDRKALGRLHG